MAYSPTNAVRLRTEAGDLPSKLAREFAAIAAGGAGHSAPPLLVAASDSLYPDRADYVCDGVDDQVQIQAAIDALPDIGGKITFMSGMFSINDTISVDLPVIWQGSGGGEFWGGAPSGYIGTLFAATASMDKTLVDIVSGHYYGAFFNLGFSGYLQPPYATLTDTAAIHLANGGYSILSSVGFFDLPYRAPLHIHNSIVTTVESCYFEKCKVCSEGAIVVESTQNWVKNCYFAGNNRSMVIDADQQMIHNCAFSVAKDHHILTRGTEKISISDCRFDSWNGDAGTYPAIKFGSDSCEHYDIHDNVFDGAGCTTMAIHDDDKAVDYIMIHNNDFHGFGAVVPVDMTFANANGIVRNNMGFVTENAGTATLPSTSTSIAVTHGLAATPAAGDIVVTPIKAWGNMAQFYIDTYTATQFTIHADVAPGVDVDFAWKAIIL